MSRRPARRRWFAVAAVTALALAASCGDDPSAEDQVCDARSELRDSLEQVAADVQAANFGDASDDLDQVRSAYDDLVAAVGDLAQEERETLAPQVDALESDIAALQDVQNLDDLSAGLDAVGSQTQDIYDEIDGTLSCD